MPTADLLDGKLVVECSLRENPLVQAIPGSSWNEASRRWRFTPSWSACLALRGTFGERLEVGDELAAWAWRESDSRVGPALAARERATTTFALGSLGARIREVQRGL